MSTNHLRELQRAWEVEEQEWAVQMKELLVKASRAVGDAKGQLGEKEDREYRMQYRKILEEAEDECS